MGKIDLNSLSIVFNFLCSSEYISCLRLDRFWNAVGMRPESFAYLPLRVTPLRGNGDLYFQSPSPCKPIQAPTMEQLKRCGTLILVCNISSHYEVLRDELPKISLWDRFWHGVKGPEKLNPLKHFGNRTFSTGGAIDVWTSACPKLFYNIRCWLTQFHSALSSLPVRHIVFEGLLISECTWRALAACRLLESITFDNCSNDSYETGPMLGDMHAPFRKTPRCRSLIIKRRAWVGLQALVMELLTLNLLESLTIESLVSTNLPLDLKRKNLFSECTSLKRISLSGEGSTFSDNWLETLAREAAQSRSLENVEISSIQPTLYIFEIPTLKSLKIVSPFKLVYFTQRVEETKLEELTIYSYFTLGTYRFRNLRTLTISFRSLVDIFRSLVEKKIRYQQLGNLRQLNIMVPSVFFYKDIDLLVGLLREHPLPKVDVDIRAEIYPKYQLRITSLVKELDRERLLKSIKLRFV